MPAGPPCGSPFLRIDLDDASSIAIDGPAASGKTAVGMLLAKRMGYRFLDTGAMYRAVTLAAVDRAVDLGDLRTGVGVSLLVGSHRLASRGGVRFDLGYALDPVEGRDGRPKRWVGAAFSDIDF